MTDDPWGRDDAPLVSPESVPALPPRLADLARLVESGETRELAPGDGPFMPTRAEELPEVATAERAGWRSFDSGGYGLVIVAAWPGELRGWLEDRRPRIIFRQWLDGRREVVPDSGRGDPYPEMCQIADECGLPPPPRGRIWLLRSPWPVLGVEVVLRTIWLRVEADEVGPRAVLAAAREILALTTDQVWERLAPETRASAEAWSAVGRSGEDVVDLVCLGLHPAHLERLRSAEPVGESLTEAQAARWVRAVSSFEVDVDTAVERVALWRALGVPAPDGDRWPWPLSDLSPAEARTWLEAGFTVDDLEAWLGVDLASAEVWRAAGFGSGAARELLLADPQLTPLEAQAFDAAGISPEARTRWVATGFSADEARAWTDLDIVPAEARVWRSVSLGPEAADAQLASGRDASPPLPHGVAVGWGATGPGRDDVSYGVMDPPGTRGSDAMMGWHGMPDDLPPDGPVG